jgi:hypothetical protein
MEATMRWLRCFERHWERRDREGSKGRRGRVIVFHRLLIQVTSSCSGASTVASDTQNNGRKARVNDSLLHYEPVHQGSTRKLVSSTIH